VHTAGRRSQLFLELARIILMLMSLLQLSKYPVLNNLEKQTSVPKVYAFLGLIGVYFFFIFFNFGGQFLTNLAGFIIPGYYSLDALFSASKVDDTQWLTVRSTRLESRDFTNFSAVLGRVRIFDVCTPDPISDCSPDSSILVYLRVQSTLSTGSPSTTRSSLSLRSGSLFPRLG